MTAPQGYVPPQPIPPSPAGRPAPAWAPPVGRRDPKIPLLIAGIVVAGLLLLASIGAAALVAGHARLGVLDGGPARVQPWPGGGGPGWRGFDGPHRPDRGSDGPQGLVPRSGGDTKTPAPTPTTIPTIPEG
ncbi:hypothetical protein [Xylanimonas sp. McL0601]|uniref:hypothetical protein n=1 Tax=Xylanimonas sp. McL0601 TaxID=3414739 RepID=UPI003CEDD473